MKKTVDCITFLNEAAENTRLRLADLPIQEQTAYWRARNRAILAEQKRVMKETGASHEFGFVQRLQALRKHRKSFDCVEMKHQAQECIRKELEGKSPREQAAYWRERTQALLEQQAKLTDQGRKAR